MNVLLLIGAGASVELGVPAMAGLADEFLEHVKQWQVEPELVEKLIGDTQDIEHLIEQLDQISTASSSLTVIGQNTEALKKIESIRAEVEWFVQHAADRVLSRSAHLMWGAVLDASEDHNVTIASTNYDRAIELAANAENRDIDDGYSVFGQKETAEWTGFNPKSSRTELIKLHGSIDWYLDESSGDSRKLRHSMPLFGRGTLKLSNGIKLGSALILPSREKLLTRNPYPRLSQAFLNAVDQADLIIVIGSSLRDQHLQSAVKGASNQTPVFQVSPSGSNYGIDKAIGFPSNASSFLVGILPAALRHESPAEYLSRISPPARTINCLEALQDALDVNKNEVTRCAAIDELLTVNVPLDKRWLAKPALN